jgi:uncharacterized membrane protein
VTATVDGLHALVSRSGTRLLVTGAIVWATLLPMAAAAASAPRGAVARSTVFLVYGVGSVVCHQRPERSFHWGATPWPVCARCTGVYAGAAIMALLMFVWRSPSVRTAGQARWWFAMGLLPAVASLAYEWRSGVMPSHVLRMATGLPLGAAVVTLVLAVLSEADESERRDR